MSEADDRTDDDSTVDGSDDEALQDVLAVEMQRRLWLRSIVPILQARSQENDPSDRVQLALDWLTIAACERARRILRSDLGADHG